MTPLALKRVLAFVSVRKRVNVRARRGIYLLGSSWLGDLLIRRVCQVWSIWAAGVVGAWERDLFSFARVVREKIERG